MHIGTILADRFIMNTPASDISIRLPEWLTTFMAEDHGMYADKVSRMQLALGLACQNIDQNTGGSFGLEWYYHRNRQIDSSVLQGMIKGVW